VWKCIGAILPRYLTVIYNGCLKEGISEMVGKRLIPIAKPGKQGNDEVPPHNPN
jgi:hypothetical protein